MAEPHDHRILNGSVQLLSWQVAGRSSRRLPNWLLTKVDEMTDIVLLDQTFPGGRPTASANHIQWEVLLSGSDQLTVTYGPVTSSSSPRSALARPSPLHPSVGTRRDLFL
jgi:hypothetical protein